MCSERNGLRQSANSRLDFGYERDELDISDMSDEDIAWSKLFEKLGGKAHVAAYVQEAELSAIKDELINLGHPDTLTEDHLIAIKSSFAAKSQKEKDLLSRCNLVVERAGGLESYAELLNTGNTKAIMQIMESLGLSEDDFVE